MKSNKYYLPFVTRHYFEGVFYGIGWILISLSLYLLFLKWYIGLIVAFLGYFIVSTHYRLVIDSSQNKIEDYLFVLGLKREREEFKYNKLECLFISASKYSQQLNHQSISTVVRGALFKAYLKTDTHKHYLGESRDLKLLESKIQSIAEKYNLEIRTP